MIFWNAHYDERGFASMHVYHAGTGLPVATILRPAKTPNGREVRTVIKHLTKRILKGKRKPNLSITHKFRDQRRGADADFLESQESVVIPCLAPDSKSRVLDGDEKQQIGVACTRIPCVGGTRRG